MILNQTTNVNNFKIKRILIINIKVNTAVLFKLL